MFDPVSNFKLNRIFSKVKDLPTALTNVSGDLSFTKAKLTELETTTAEVLAIVNAILGGGTVVEWIADLEENGIDSLTYKSKQRMEELAVTKDALINSKVNSLVFKYAVEHNLHIGNTFKALMGDVSGVTWSNYPNVTTIANNLTAFQAIANNTTACALFFGRIEARRAVFANADALSGTIIWYANVRDALFNIAEKQTYTINSTNTSKTFTKNMWIGRFERTGTGSVTREVKQTSADAPHTTTWTGPNDGTNELVSDLYDYVKFTRVSGSMTITIYYVSFE